MTMTSMGPVVSRRKLFAIVGAASVTAALPLAGATTAAADVAGSALPSAAAVPVAGPAVSTLPRLYGTPTDLARTRDRHAFTRAADGTVHRFDKTSQLWTRTAVQDWSTVLTWGTAYLARWGRPTGNELVMVFGTEPPPTAPTTPDPTPTDDGTTVGPTTTSDTRPSPPTTGPDPTTSGRPVPSGISAPPRSPLAYTGAPLAGIALAGIVAVGAGAALTFRRRRMHPPEHTEYRDPGTADSNP